MGLTYNQQASSISLTAEAQGRVLGILVYASDKCPPGTMYFQEGRPGKDMAFYCAPGTHHIESFYQLLRMAEMSRRPEPYDQEADVCEACPTMVNHNAPRATPQQDDRLEILQKCNDKQYEIIQGLREDLRVAQERACACDDTAANLEELQDLRAQVEGWKNGRDYYLARYEELSDTLDRMMGVQDVLKNELFIERDRKDENALDREWDALISDRNMFRDEAAFLHTHLDDRDALLENCRDLLREECIAGDDLRGTIEELKVRIGNQFDTIIRSQSLAHQLVAVLTGHGPSDTEF